MFKFYSCCQKASPAVTWTNQSAALAAQFLKLTLATTRRTSGILQVLAKLKGQIPKWVKSQLLVVRRLCAQYCGDDTQGSLRTACMQALQHRGARKSQSKEIELMGTSEHL